MPKPLAATGPKLPYLKDREFEEEASLLLTEYGAQYGEVTNAPVPIDDIVELFLGLHLEFCDMEDLFGVDDVHGALWVNKKKVGINQLLDPSSTPAMLGRYRFTLAHEAGHWRLHRKLFIRAANQLLLLTDNVDRPEYICRSSDTQPIEYQANRFASCVLMPREMLLTAWETWHGSLVPLCLEDLQASTASREPVPDRANDEYIVENAIRPLAEQFEVSPQAMRIRLEGLKLVVHKREKSLF